MLQNDLNEVIKTLALLATKDHNWCDNNKFSIKEDLQDLTISRLWMPQQHDPATWTHAPDGEAPKENTWNTREITIQWH